MISIRQPISSELRLYRLRSFISCSTYNSNAKKHSHTLDHSESNVRECMGVLHLQRMNASNRLSSAGASSYKSHCELVKECYPGIRCYDLLYLFRHCMGFSKWTRFSHMVFISPLYRLLFGKTNVRCGTLWNIRNSSHCYDLTIKPYITFCSEGKGRGSRHPELSES